MSEPSSEEPSEHQGTAKPAEQRTGNQGQVEERPGDDAARRIGVYSDPGRTSMFVRRLLDGESLPGVEDVKVTHQQLLLPLRQDTTLDLDEVQRWARQDDADITVVVTEIPRVGSAGPMSAEIHFAERLVVISLPALGPVAITKALRRELGRAITTLDYGSLEKAHSAGRLSWRLESQQGGASAYISPQSTVLGRGWMTLGMVAANEPVLSLPKLSGMFAAGCAAGAFGIFYDTIWDMAISLPGWRLGAVALAAITIVVVWLLLTNRLWDRPADVGSKRLAVMYTVSTVSSLLVSVAALYLFLFVGILLMALVLIEPDFMAESIQVDATFAEYLDIAWLSASLGTLAGAIGSNFDDDSHLQNLTQGSRELQRYPRDDAQR